MPEPLDYYAPSNRRLSPARPLLPTLAITALAVPFIAAVVGCVGLQLTGSGNGNGNTPAKAETIELICMLVPQCAAAVFAARAWFKLSIPPRRRGRPLAIAGFLLSVALFMLEFFVIVSSNAWLD